MGWSGFNASSPDPAGWVQKVIGLLVSGFALSPGAPFWFDRLRKLASIGAVGKNPVERGQDKPRSAGAWVPDL